MTPSLATVKKFSGDAGKIANYLAERARKVMRDVFVHPGVPAWEEAKAKLKEEFAAREATLDGDFRDIEDEFTLGLKEIKDLPQVLLDLEARSW